MKKFADLELQPALLQALAKLGYETATPVQKNALPTMLQGRDVLVQAQTGSGKTAAFSLAMLSGLNSAETCLQGLVLCPTRELADQVAKELRALARFIPNVKILTLCGGVSIRPQLASLSHEPHIVVGTPGRVQDLLKRKVLPLNRLKMVVLDEADRMLDMGFIDAMDRILASTPSQRTTWLFSATYTDEVLQTSKRFQRQAEEIRLQDQSVHERPMIKQHFYKVERADKLDALKTLLVSHAPESCLVFCNTKIDCKNVAAQLKQSGFSALALHGDLDQRDRDETVVQFANGSCQILVATDVASRGLHIEGLPMVIAYELPNDPSVHVHRIGRTGRAGESGLARCLVSGREQSRALAIEEDGSLKLDWAQLPSDGRASPIQAAGMKTLIIDAGRKDKLRAGDVLGALTGSGGLNGSDVGKIDVFATRSYVAVPRSHARSVVKNLRSAKIKGRKFRIREL